MSDNHPDPLAGLAAFNMSPHNKITNSDEAHNLRAVLVRSPMVRDLMFTGVQ